jgi:hypothetical protein
MKKASLLKCWAVGIGETEILALCIIQFWFDFLGSFMFHSIPVLFSWFKVKMDKITRTE